MKPTMSQMLTWYKEFNRVVFKNELPIVHIKFTNTRRQLGQFYWGNGRGIGIKISLFWNRNEEQYRNTLLHEMCHLYCYNRGWVNEHHGNRWQKIADYATRVTGLQITRVADITGWEVNSGNEGKMEAVMKKMNAPALLVDLDYGDHHFVIKTTKNVLLKGESTTWDNKLKTGAKHYRIFISDDPYFKRYSTSRSIHRGYKYFLGDYVRTIEPKLEQAVEVLDLSKLFRGGYDNYLSN